MKGFGKILIMGDSYSTFSGHMPDGYYSWYPRSAEETDVTDVSDTWWHKLISETDTTLIRNDSFSGSTVSSTEREEVPGTHFNLRADRLINNGFFKENEIDTIFIFGATNDSWINSPLGEIKYDGITDDDIKCIFPAFAALISKLKTVSPKSRIIPLINCDLKPEVVYGIEEICRHYGLTYIKFDTIEKISGHPSRKGMEQIKNAIINLL